MDNAQVFTPHEIVHGPAGARFPVSPGSSLESHVSAIDDFDPSPAGFAPFGQQRLEKHEPGPPRVLLVEDDNDLRQVMQVLLESTGVEVVACCDGEAAELAFGGGEGFDLLVTDLEMPGMSGAHLASNLTSKRPALPVMIVSGAILREGQLEEFQYRGWTFLGKPFNLAQLLSQVKRLIDSRRAPGAPLFSNPASHRNDGCDDRAALQSERLQRTSRLVKHSGRILLVGDDPMLLGTRQMILQQEGYTAVVKNTWSDFDEAILSSVDALVICRSVSNEEALVVAMQARAISPALPIVRLAEDGETMEGERNVLCSYGSTPEAMLSTVAHLVEARMG